jgi:site-specific DNA recombinase
VWNKSRKRDAWGQRAERRRAEAEWISQPAPHLRIVTDDVWAAAHAQIARNRTTMHLGGRGRRRDSKYHPPGLARCAICGGGLHVRTKTRAHGRYMRTYACTSHYDRGATICPNALQISMERTDEAVIRAIGDILRPAMIETVIAGVRTEMQRAHEADPRTPIEAEIAQLEQEVARPTEAIVMGGPLAPLVTRLQAAEGRRQQLQETLATIERPVVPYVDWAAQERHARRLLDDWRGLLLGSIEDARSLLRSLLDGETIAFTPLPERAYRFEGSATMSGILEGIVGVSRMASPGGLEPPAYRLGGGRSIH